ncbi:hypothetical protein CDV55_108638 [Aspergillus turcosus]|nr:hypothetical protein CDV55_108638 [Aspergillus turcosus]
MDPFSISVGVASLTGLVAQALSATKGYISGAKNANDSVHTLIIELETLQSSLSNVEGFLKGNDAKGLAFQMDGWSLVSRTSDDVVKVLEAQVEGLKALQAIQAQAEQLQQAIENRKGLSEKDHDAVQRKAILDWISTPAQKLKHQTVRSARVSNTGGWLLERQEYLQWRDNGSDHSLLWCHGVQGSGKTVLASKIIDDLQSSVEGTGRLLAFYYFDYKETQSNIVNRVLSSILAQLVAGLPKPPKSVAAAYEKSHDSASSLTQNELERLISDAVRESQRVYIIFDALDECCSSADRKTLLGVFLRLVETHRLCILVTSRPHLSDISTVLYSHSAIEIQAQESDIRAYVRQELGKSDVDDIVDEAFATRIADTLARLARGMFLLPIIHLRTLLSQPTAGDMEHKLASMPIDLFVAFEETINRIQRLPEARARLAMNTLMWICHAKRTLTVLEIRDALAVKLGQTSRCPQYCPTPRMIVDCCQGLVVIDPSTLHVRFVHYTIQEYLSRRSGQAVAQIHAHMAMTCLTYLLFDTVQSGPHSDEDEISLIPDENPLASYASAHWGDHVRVSENARNVYLATMTFLFNRKARACAEQLMRFNSNYVEIYWTPEECYSVTALHVACHFGLENTLLSRIQRVRGHQYTVKDWNNTTHQSSL